MLILPGSPEWDEPPRRTRKSRRWEEARRGRQAGLTRLQPGACCAPCSPPCAWLCGAAGTAPAGISMTVTTIGTHVLTYRTSPPNWDLGTDPTHCLWEWDGSLPDATGCTLIFGAISGGYVFWISLHGFDTGLTCVHSTSFEKIVPAAGSQGDANAGFQSTVSSASCTGTNLSFSGSFSANEFSVAFGSMPSQLFFYLGGVCNSGASISFNVDVSS